ncbi:MAG: DNA-3-methyladenine glycosylase [Sulfuricellaceae bacterium]|jgi:DNA-3-methyladenine glycosylase II
MTPAYWNQASDELAQRDATLAPLIARHRHESLKSRGDPFATLARSIVGQQISVKASESVWQRFLAALPAPTPEAVAAAAPEALRACGLSQRKVEYIRDLAGHFREGRIHPAKWTAMDDEAIIAELTDVRGIGRWTAEMFLIFNLMRPDVLPLDDIGLQRAMALHYNGGEALPRKELRAIGESWRPWRSVATWYLWRALDPEPVEY